MISAEIDEAFRIQKKKALTDIPTLAQRTSKLLRIEKLIKENVHELNAAMEKDFGGRSEQVSFVADILPVLMHLGYVKNNIRKWIKPQRKRTDFPFYLTGAHAYILHEPLGVVCIIGAYNSPITTTLTGAIDAIAAGNRVIIKPSESAMNTAVLLKRLVTQYFSIDEMIVLTGGKDVGRCLSALPFDFMMFTGSSVTAKEIMKAAAPNITPMLLELGGKSPVIVLSDANPEFVAKKLVRAKLLNSGQICISPDHVVIHSKLIPAFVECLKRKASEILAMDECRHAPIVDRRKYDELTCMIEEARVAGCEITTVHSDLPVSGERSIPFTIVLNPPSHLSLVTNEIFGPVLPLIPYNTVDDIIHFLNRGEKPLSMYIFGKNRKSRTQIIKRVSAGGVCVNDFFLQAGQARLPFGGVGKSGFGRFRGNRSGFDTFSNPKSVFEQGLLQRITTSMIPPFSKQIFKLYKIFLRIK